MPPNTDVKELGLEGLADEQKRQEVESYFKARQDLLKEIVSDKKSPKEVLQDKMKEYNTTQVQTQQIIDGIITELQKDSLERDLNEGYTDAEGAHDSYIEQFHKEVERVGVDFEGDDKDRENPVRKACLAEVIKLIRAVPTNLKRSYRHEYVKDMIADYVKQMDDKAETLTVGTLHLDELKELKIKTVKSWMEEPGRPSEKELTQTYSADQAKEFVQGAAKTRDNLAKAEQQYASFPPELKTHFEATGAGIKGLVADNPAGAAESSQRLADEVAAVAGIITLKGEIAAKINETTDEALKKRYTDLSAKIDANLKGLPLEKDPTKRKGLIDLAVLQGEKGGIDATATAGTAGATDGAGAETTPEANPEPDMMKDPGGWIKFQFNEFKKYITEIMGFITGIAGFFGAKKVGETLGQVTAGIDKLDPAKMEKVTKFLKEKFGITEDESKQLAAIKLGDFLKMTTKPDWMDEARFNKLKASVALNKVDSDKDDTVMIDFIITKKDNWKEQSVAPATQPAAPAATPATQAAAPAQPSPAKPPETTA